MSDTAGRGLRYRRGRPLNAVHLDAGTNCASIKGEHYLPPAVHEGGDRYRGRVTSETGGGRFQIPGGGVKLHSWSASVRGGV